LTEAVLADINRFAVKAKNDDKAVIAIRQKLSVLSDSEAKTREREQRRLKKRLTELDRLFAALYEDRANKKISERNYATLSASYEQEQIEADNHLKEIEMELTAKGLNDRGVKDFVFMIRNYEGLTELTAPIINKLIDRITVSEREQKPDGTIEQHIRIYYKFIGALNDATVYYTGHTTFFAEDKTCTRCGMAFRPNSNVAKYCPACSKEVRRQQSNESKARSRARAQAAR
jgi:predicted RNA-binding Zn-ribbon protein involved in translation (DUF1610 family)